MSEEDGPEEERSVGYIPTWSIASVLTAFILVSVLLERSIHRLSNWLKKINRKPLHAAVEKMKGELMLLGFVSLLLTATSSVISGICVPTKLYGHALTPCTNGESSEELRRKLSMAFVDPHSFRRGMLTDLVVKTCPEEHEPFVSREALEQLHRFMFVMAVTHIAYSCLTMVLAMVKIHSWRVWEDEAHLVRSYSINELTRALTVKRNSTFAKAHGPNSKGRSRFIVWLVGFTYFLFPLAQICFFRQFGHSVARADYLTLRQGFIVNHNLSPAYDFNGYMISSMEEEFHRIVGVSAKLWGFVVTFMLFDLKGTHLYFWVAVIPVTLVLLVGAKLQHVIATLALESVGVRGTYGGPMFQPRDELFWFKKPELLLSLIHFILFQNSFELASFAWFWWQFGYNSCFLKNHLDVYIRLLIGFTGQILCSYSTLPLYALVTQMGSKYKAALIPHEIRETIYGWKREAQRKRRVGTLNAGESTPTSVEEYESQLSNSRQFSVGGEIELQEHTVFVDDCSTVSVPRHRPWASISSTDSLRALSDSFHRSDSFQRSESMPR